MGLLALWRNMNCSQEPWTCKSQSLLETTSSYDPWRITVIQAGTMRRFT